MKQMREYLQRDINKRLVTVERLVQTSVCEESKFEKEVSVTKISEIKWEREAGERNGAKREINEKKNCKKRY